jgi:single-stranded-DNA-specific exonuclease
MKKIIVRRAITQTGDTLPAGLHPILRRVYLSRQLHDARELEYSLDGMYPYAGLKGIDDAAALLSDILQRRKRILIVADFDADGATSCAVAVRGLHLLGARDVRFVVPNRFEYGYGLTPEIVAVAAEQRPDLIITVDNGISSNDGVAAARERGIQVMVTDHHLPGERLPAADAIVNPNQPGDVFPSKNLAGVGVIFYVLMALRVLLREQQWFSRTGIAEPNLAQLLDLVALGTVADVVALDRNNRILVSQGLARIRAGRCCAGIRALLEVAGRNSQQLVAADLGFAVAPRLNAAGRLEDMTLGIACLLSDDIALARMMAARLDQLNHERRGIESRMQEEALAAIGALRIGEDDDQSPAGVINPGLGVGVCLFQPHWHLGVIGILASRIKDRLHRPVIAFAQANDNELKGSARSVSGVHIRDVLDAVAAHHPGLLTKFGGHAMAAGLTLPGQNLAAFSAAFDEEVRRYLAPEDVRGVILSDGELAREEMSLDLAELLRSAGPWGQAFPEPVFDGTFEVVNRRIVGERHLKMVIKASGDDRPVDAIAFNAGEREVPLDAARIRIAYKLDVNEYRGQRSAQLLVEHIEMI